MTERDIIRALKGSSRTVNLSSRKLRKISPSIGSIKLLEILNLKGNELKDLPSNLALLQQLHSINLGNNLFETIPDVLAYLSSLRSVHLFGNKISWLSPRCLNCFENVTLLNLNNNNIKELPPEICRLSCVESLSLDSNELTEVPVQICHLANLKELHLADNSITSLPESIAFLEKLRKLYLQKNCLSCLPEGLTKCRMLEVLDVSANQLTMFPSQLEALPLKELYCEQNNLLKCIPVKSVKEDEVLSLKELCSRSIAVYLRDKSSPYSAYLPKSSLLQLIFLNAYDCVVCHMPFVNTWLECVRFLDCKKGLCTKLSARTIPLRGRLCSYKCFHSEGHQYFGVADFMDE